MSALRGPGTWRPPPCSPGGIWSSDTVKPSRQSWAQSTVLGVWVPRAPDAIEHFSNSVELHEILGGLGWRLLAGWLFDESYTLLRSLIIEMPWKVWIWQECSAAHDVHMQAVNHWLCKETSA